MSKMSILSSGCIVVSVILLFAASGFAQLDCPSADLTGDCFVNLADVAVMARQWLTGIQLQNDMRHVRGGDFSMGDHDLAGIGPDGPVHAVHVSSFHISRFEVTNQQYCDQYIGNTSP